MSLIILDENWDSILNKVIKPLWKSKFENKYKSVKLDEADFISLAGEELTKAFMNYVPEESNIYTYSNNVMKKKGDTAIRDRLRLKRQAEVQAVSLYSSQDDYDISLDELIEDESMAKNESSIACDNVKEEIYRHLKPKERKIINLTIEGYTNEIIAKKLNMCTRDVNDIKQKISSKSEIRRIARMYGYLGGNENEI